MHELSQNLWLLKIRDMAKKLTITKPIPPVPFEELTAEAKMKKLYKLIELSMMLSKGPLKLPQGKGLVIRKPKAS